VVHPHSCWATDVRNAEHHAVVLEEVAMMASDEQQENLELVLEYLLHQHFMRKHGPNACYGQEA
jgi:L-ribulose-5-phosphate 4-epimerase